jgi:hypothetical protein
MFFFPEVRNVYLYTDIQLLYEHNQRHNDMVAATVARLIMVERYLNPRPYVCVCWNTN